LLAYLFDLAILMGIKPNQRSKLPWWNHHSPIDHTM